MVAVNGSELFCGAGCVEAAKASFRRLLVPGSIALASDTIGFVTMRLIEIRMIQEVQLEQLEKHGLHTNYEEEARYELETGREVFEASVSTLGLYLPEQREVVLSPLVVAPLIKKLPEDAPRHTREAVMHQKTTVAHELVHALQEQHFGLPSKLRAAEEVEDILRYKWLIEGHAVLVEERIAEGALGLEDFMIKGPYGGLAVGSDPSYVQGRKYFLHLLRTGGMKAVRASLEQPPTFAQMKELTKKPLPPVSAAPEQAPPKPPKPKKQNP